MGNLTAGKRIFIDSGESKFLFLPVDGEEPAEAEFWHFPRAKSTPL
jgi:hypothetical protein